MMIGGPGHLENALKQIQRYVLTWFFISGIFLIGGWWLASQYLVMEPVILLGGLVAGWTIITTVIGTIVARTVASPLKALSEAVLHISPSPIPIASPNLNKLHIGQELVTGLVRQIYNFNTGVGGEAPVSVNPDMGLQQLPVAVISLDEQALVTFANAKALEIAGGTESLVGKSLYTLFDILFKDSSTLQNWISEASAHSITAQKIWRGVRITPYGGKAQYVDLAASYSKPAQQAGGILLTLFDETEVYGEEDTSLGFVALAVHELRTPLTILRGYIEVLEDELKESNQPELQEIMRKMRASAENLTAFVGNILDVARVNEGQLSLKMREENWKEVLTRVVEDMRLRAGVRGKTIELSIAENLPTAGIDSVSISEVMNNLLDNAIKYSPDDKKIIKVASGLTADGLIETTVQDFGVGIPGPVIPHLFEKFSRSHQTRTSVSGSGLGLYLSKALVSAHGGNIWVRSKDKEGSTFGFTVLPYSRLADQAKTNDNDDITRSAHGWIKNHTLSRH